MKQYIAVVVFDGVAQWAEIHQSKADAEKFFKTNTEYTLAQINDAEPDSEAGHFQGSEIFEVKASVGREDRRECHAQGKGLRVRVKVE